MKFLRKPNDDDSVVRFVRLDIECLNDVSAFAHIDAALLGAGIDGLHPLRMCETRMGEKCLSPFCYKIAGNTSVCLRVFVHNRKDEVKVGVNQFAILIT